MPASVDYHCSCQSSVNAPPPPHLSSSSYSFHPLHSLYFCEECDAVRCNRCVSVEVSVYYCPNCLFEVPSASVRAEKNRCARNCFLCPQCHNTLSTVSSDPPDDGLSSSMSLGVVGEPPFLLQCNNCRWDSGEAGITFEKPTGLAVQLQKSEDSAPDHLEFERLKEHFEPFLRAASLSSSQAPSSSTHSHVHHVNPITAAASSALARDIPGVAKHNPVIRNRGGKDKSLNKDEMTEYRSRIEVGGTTALGNGGVKDVELLKHLESTDDIASLEQRWVGSWATSLRAKDLRPLRIPLRAKQTKRCGTCQHILIKPEQKAQTVRYKIKLMAANYLPDITATLPHVQTAALSAATASAKRIALKTSTASVPEDNQSVEGMLAGKTYPFQLAFTNPLYDPIHVRLSVQRHYPQETASPASTTDTGTETKPRRPPFAVSLPSSIFQVGAFAEAWEYEDDEDMDDDEVPERLGLERAGAGAAGGKSSRTKTVGVLEKKANITVVGGEVVIGKEARGEVKFNMLVSYTYRSDEPGSESDDTLGERASHHHTNPAKSAAAEMKTFSFYTVVDLGSIVPKEEKENPMDLEVY